MSKKKNVVKAIVGGGSTFSRIWIVPVAAVLIGLWMTYAHWSSQGPLIRISFVSGEGIEAGKTKVRRKNVDIGEVLELSLSEDTDNVVLSVRVYKHAADLLREDSKFWVVRPRIGKGGVSGLSTLLSGAYIEMSPGSSDETAREFT
ncbi:MAG: MCE family protein, partial [Gammaproteobacteria bacterium]|nr:MCE family protein [Gammaproteobacteria bacterium]